jgi:ABC-2 type transport system ATP-binding protein
VALYAVRAANTHKLLAEVRAYKGTDSCFAFGDSLHVTLKADTTEGADGAARLTDYLHERGLADAAIEKITPGIEDCFIHLLKD